MQRETKTKKRREKRERKSRREKWTQGKNYNKKDKF